MKMSIIAGICCVSLSWMLISGPAPAESETESRLTALEDACRMGAQEEIFRAVGDLQAEWGTNPDFPAIKSAILSRSGSVDYRWLMIDSLVRYKRSVPDGREAFSLLNLLDQVAWAEDEPPDLRAKALTVQAGMIALFQEKGFISEKRRSEFGQKIALLLAGKQDGRLLTAGCIAAGRSRSGEAVAALQKILQSSSKESKARRTAAGALGKLNDRKSIPRLTNIIEATDDRELFGSCAFALGVMGGEEVVAPLVSGAGRFDTNSCRNALRRNAGDIKRMLEDPESPGLQSAIRAVEVASLEDCRPQLLALENDRRPEVRRSAAAAQRTLEKSWGNHPPGAGKPAEEMER